MSFSVSKVRIFNLASGVSMKSVGELLHGSTTDVSLTDTDCYIHSQIFVERIRAFTMVVVRPLLNC